MDLFEQYQKDWKKGKANQESNPLSNLKNKEIMDQLIQYEKTETKYTKLGLACAFIGIVSGLWFGINEMIEDGGTITPTIIGGIALMLFSICYTAYNALKREPMQSIDQNTTNYLVQAKERLIARAHQSKKGNMLYIVLLFIGTGMATSKLAYFLLAALVLNVLIYFFWNVEKSPFLKKQLAELDKKIANLK